MALALVVGVLAALGHDRTTFVVALALPLAILLFRYPWTAVLLFVAIQPLIVVGDGVAGAENWAVGRLLVPVLLAIALAYRMLGLSRSYFRLSVTDIAIAAFLVIAVANIWLLSGNPVRMTMEFYDHIGIPIALYWLIRVIEPREGELRWLLWVLAGVVALEFAVGALSWLAPSVLPRDWLGRAGERTVGTVRGPAPYTTTLMVGAMLAVAFLDTRRSGLTRLALYRVDRDRLYRHRHLVLPRLLGRAPPSCWWGCSSSNERSPSGSPPSCWSSWLGCSSPTAAALRTM